MVKAPLCLNSIPNLYLLLEAPHPKPTPANRDSPNCTCIYYCDIHPHLYLSLGLPPESAPVPRPLSVPVYVMGPSHPYLYLLVGLLSVSIMRIPIHTRTWYWDPHTSLYPLPGPLSIPTDMMGPLSHTCTLGPVPTPILITGTPTPTSTCYRDPCLCLLSGCPSISVPTTAFSLVSVVRSSPIPVTVTSTRPCPRGPARPRRYLLAAVGGADGTAVVQDDAPGPRQHQRRRHLRSGPAQPRHQHRRPGQPPRAAAQHVPAGTGGGRQRGPAPLPRALPRSCGAPVPGAGPPLTAAASTAAPPRFPP